MAQPPFVPSNSVSTVAEIVALPADTESVFVRRLSDAKAAALSHLNSLRIIFGDGSPDLTDLALESLGKITTLEVLDLEWASFTDTGLRHLERLTRLRWLDLTGCRGFSDAALQALCSALPACKIEPHSSIENG